MKINIGYDSIAKIVNLKKRFTEQKNDIESGKILEKIAPIVNSSIQIRVQDRGEGVRGKMPKYSQMYVLRKSATGRQAVYRDLTYSGNMFQSLTYRIEGRRAILFFNSEAERKKAQGNQKRYPFFGIGVNEKRVIKELAKKYYGKI